jgi:hypothetical protein
MCGMDWRAKLPGLLDAVSGLALPAWVAPTATLLSLVLLLTLLAALIGNLRLRRELADRAGGAAALSAPVHTEDRPSAASLEGEGQALLDRWLPRRPRNFLLAVLVLAIGCWALGLVLADDVRAFLASTEWQVQPPYLAAHFVTVRLFATAFVRTFLTGIAHLDVAAGAAQHRMWLVLGPVGVLIAAVLAAPFCIYDYPLLADPETGGGAGPAANWLLFAMWCVEWLLMAFIWVMVAGYALLTHWAVARHRFRAVIEVVLHGRQYRPFLQMSVQGATIVLGFWIINIAYVWYSGGALTDYTGAVITLVLVVIGFLPPLLELRGKVSRAVSDEMTSLRKRLDRLLTRTAPADFGAGAAATARELEERLDEALVMLRISYLEKLYAELGQSEAMDIVVKLLVPITTVAWYGYKYYSGMP